MIFYKKGNEDVVEEGQFSERVISCRSLIRWNAQG